jgi:hypothetical protein
MRNKPGKTGKSKTRIIIEAGHLMPIIKMVQKLIEIALRNRLVVLMLQPACLFGYYGNTKKSY